MFFYPFNYLQRNTQAVTLAAEKLKHRNLPIEQILDEDELMNDLKFSNASQLVNHLTKEDLFGIINYVIREPEVDEHKLAYKYPFNAADILSGENTYLLDKFFEDSNTPDEDKYEELDDYEVEKHKEENEEAEVEKEESKKKSEEKENDNENENEREKEKEKEKEKENENENENENEKDILDEMDEVVEKIQKLEIMADNEKDEKDEELKIEKIKVNDSERDANIEDKPENKENETKDANDCDVIMNLNEEVLSASVIIEEKKEIDNNDNEEMVNQEDIQKDDQNKNEKAFTPKYEVFDYFLTFLDSEKDLNYVLCGYFAKIFNSLKYNRPAAVTRYLYLYKKEYLNKMIYHLNRKAIADTLLKVLLIDACEIAADLTFEFEVGLKYDIVERILDSFDITDEERSQNICDLLCEALNNRKFSIMLMKNATIVNKIQNLLLSNINSEFFKELLKLTTKLSDTVLREIKIKLNKDQGLSNENIYDKGLGAEFEDMMPNKPVESLDFKECPYIMDILSHGLDLIVKDFIDEDTNVVRQHTTYDQTVIILGTRKLLEFEYLKIIFEILLLSLNNKIFDLDPEDENEIDEHFENYNSHIYNNFIAKLIENNFFAKSIDNFFLHEWNNSYQKIFEELITVVISSNTDFLIDHIFVSLSFIDRIVDTSLGVKFVFNSGKFINNGYLPFVMEISYNIINSRNERLDEILAQNNKWNLFVTNFVNPIRKRFSTGLIYDPSQEMSIFKEETTLTTTTGTIAADPATTGITATIPEQVKKSDGLEFEGRNFIEVVRKHANASLSKASTNSSIHWEEQNETFDSNSNEPFFDNKFWKTDFSAVEMKKMEDILLDLD